MNQVFGLRMALATHLLHHLFKNRSQIMLFTCLKSPVASLVPRTIQTPCMPRAFLPQDHDSGSSLLQMLTSPSPWIWLARSYIWFSTLLWPPQRDLFYFKRVTSNPGHYWTCFVSICCLSSLLKYELCVGRDLDCRIHHGCITSWNSVYCTNRGT